MSLNGKTMFISGASRGIGLAIAKRAAQDGANIALIAKTAEPHPKLPGTVFTAAKELEEAGGQALPIVGDVRDPDSVEAAVAKTVEQFGGIDICVNNASAINLGSVTEVPMKRFDLMNGIQVRGTYAVSQACIPHLKGRENPHILTLSPPVLLGREWLKPTAYMMAKFGMTLCALGIAEEMRDEGIASNTLWPRTLVATAAVQNLLGGDEAMGRARKPEVYSDAAYVVLNKPSRSTPATCCCARTCWWNPASRTSRHTTVCPVRSWAWTSGSTASTRRGTRGLSRDRKRGAAGRRGSRPAEVAGGRRGHSGHRRVDESRCAAPGSALRRGHRPVRVVRRRARTGLQDPDRRPAG